jgi:dTDP-4-amino-4,6-dideoxygalactose transaminase
MKSSKEPRMVVPMSAPDLSDLERQAVERVLTSSSLSNGPVTAEFENSFAEYLGVAHAVSVSSGTSGLHLCVIAAGCQEGDLVLTSPFSFVASANAILYERAVPVFVDVDLRTGNMDAGLLQEAAADLATGAGQAKRLLPPRTAEALSESGNPPGAKAILPVHVFGQPVEMEPVVEVAESHGLRVIEDACEAIGAEQFGKRTGTFGDAGVFAFYPNKQMTTGEGGMIVTDNDQWADLFRSLRNQGRDVFDAWLTHSRLGYNYRMDELSAALGLAQLRRIDDLLAARERVAGWYDERLIRHSDVRVPEVTPATQRMSWFVYVVRLPEGVDRSTVMLALTDRGVPSRPYFSPIHLQPFYVERFGYAPGAFPRTEELARRSLALPFSGVMTEEQVDYVCEQLIEVMKQ